MSAVLHGLVHALRLVAEFVGWCVILLAIAAALTFARAPSPGVDE